MHNSERITTTPVMIKCEYVSWIVFLSHSSATRASESGSEQIQQMIKTLGLNATVSVCTPCNVVSLLSRTLIFLKKFFSHDDCTLGCKTREQKRGRTNKLMVLRFCQDDLRSQTLYVKRRHLQAQPPSHLTECGPIVTLPLCQQIHVQTMQCVNSANCLLSNQPLAFFSVILVYQHSLTMRFHPGLLPSPEGRAHRHSRFVITSTCLSWARSSYRQDANQSVFTV